MLRLDKEALKSMKEKHGLVMSYCVLKAGELLHVPAGWIIAELPEGTLIYGTRKAILRKSPEIAKHFADLLALYSTAGKPTEKMAIVLKALQS